MVPKFRTVASGTRRDLPLVSHGDAHDRTRHTVL
jgi:hypothetical protein